MVTTRTEAKKRINMFNEDVVYLNVRVSLLIPYCHMIAQSTNQWPHATCFADFLITRGKVRRPYRLPVGIFPLSPYIYMMYTRNTAFHDPGAIVKPFGSKEQNAIKPGLRKFNIPRHLTVVIYSPTLCVCVCVCVCVCLCVCGANPTGCHVQKQCGINCYMYFLLYGSFCAQWLAKHAEWSLMVQRWNDQWNTLQMSVAFETNARSVKTERTLWHKMIQFYRTGVKYALNRSFNRKGQYLPYQVLKGLQTGGMDSKFLIKMRNSCQWGY